MRSMWAITDKYFQLHTKYFDIRIIFFSWASEIWSPNKILFREIGNRMFQEKLSHFFSVLWSYPFFWSRPNVSSMFSTFKFHSARLWNKIGLLIQAFIHLILFICYQILSISYIFSQTTYSPLFHFIHTNIKVFHHFFLVFFSLYLCANEYHACLSSSLRFVLQKERKKKKKCLHSEVTLHNLDWTFEKLELLTKNITNRPLDQQIIYFYTTCANFFFCIV